MHFFYDAQGRPAFVEFDGEVYHYICNLQGDIIAIEDTTESVVAEYKYDSWGRNFMCIATDEVKELNLFKYRGYVYDEEVQWYYLCSRFYDSMVNRFISADIFVNSSNEFLGTNMYTYSLNNSVCQKDTLGMRPMLALTLQDETKEQRSMSFGMVKQGLGRASEKVYDIFDKYIHQREFKRVIEIYRFKDDTQEYYQTIIEGPCKRKRFQQFPKNEKLNVRFRISKIDAPSASDILSSIVSISGVLFSFASNSPIISSNTQAERIYISNCCDAIGYKMGNTPFPDGFTSPITGLEYIEIISIDYL